MTSIIEGAQSATTRTMDVAKLDDLLDTALLARHIAEGNVRVQVHPQHPYAIYNYTEKAAYDSVWDEVTLTCRGLIVDTTTQEVLARPFRKFFNHGQAGAAVIALDAQVHVTDKADGSLGILYPTPDSGWAVATRGSFASDQALHATDLFQREYAHLFTPQSELTVLFEIVYPQNRIVCDYGPTDDLILLGAVDKATGAVLDPERVTGWPGPSVDAFTAATFADALALEPRSNAEGVVVRCLTSGGMVKIKQEDYVRLHRIVTGLTARTVWEHMLAGEPLGGLIAPLPDEFHAWVQQVADGITDAVDAEMVRLADAYKATCAAMPAGWTPGDRAARKDFAMAAVKHPDKWALFALLDGKDIRGELLKRAKPEPYVTPSGRTYGEDTA